MLASKFYSHNGGIPGVGWGKKQSRFELQYSVPKYLTYYLKVEFSYSKSYSLTA